MEGFLAVISANPVSNQRDIQDLSLSLKTIMDRLAVIERRLSNLERATGSVYTEVIITPDSRPPCDQELHK